MVRFGSCSIKYFKTFISFCHSLDNILSCLHLFILHIYNILLKLCKLIKLNRLQRMTTRLINLIIDPDQLLLPLISPLPILLLNSHKNSPLKQILPQLETKVFLFKIFSLLSPHSGKIISWKVCRILSYLINNEEERFTRGVQLSKFFIMLRCSIQRGKFA
jgi:hypothetical protein